MDTVISLTGKPASDRRLLPADSNSDVDEDEAPTENEPEKIIIVKKIEAGNDELSNHLIIIYFVGDSMDAIESEYIPVPYKMNNPSGERAT